MPLGIEPSSFLINSQAPTPCLLWHNNLVLTRRIELLSHDYQSWALPLSYMRINFQFIKHTGLPAFGLVNRFYAMCFINCSGLPTTAYFTVTVTASRFIQDSAHLSMFSVGSGFSLPVPRRAINATLDASAAGPIRP